MDFSKVQLKDKCRLRFTKEQYFNDTTFNYIKPRPKLRRYLEELLKEREGEEFTEKFLAYYGMWVFIFTRFSKISSYPFVNLQDFAYILKSLSLNFKYQ